MAHDRLAYAVVSDASFRNRVIAFDPSTGEVLRTVREGNEFIPEIEIDSRGILAVPDRHPVHQGLCLYRTAVDPAVPETFIWCRATELPPFSITALD